MINKLLLAFFLLVNATGESESVDPRPPVQKEVLSTLDGKIVKLDGKWAIAFSDNAIQVIRSDQVERFNELMSQWNGVIPPFVIYESFENFYPYIILFPDSGETFNLIKDLAPLDVWILTLGEGKTYTLESKEYPVLGISENNFWQLTNTDHWNTIDKWSIGDTVMIVPVIAVSRHFKQIAGYLIFQGNNPDHSNGYWVQTLAN